MKGPHRTMCFSSFPTQTKIKRFSPDLNECNVALIRVSYAGAVLAEQISLATARGDITVFWRTPGATAAPRIL